MNGREELAEVLCRDDLYYDTGNHFELSIHDAADAILAAGYRKPRTITTAEELDALPHEALILTEDGGYWESIKRIDGKNWWKEPGSTKVSPSTDLTLPATVLHEGGTK